MIIRSLLLFITIFAFINNANARKLMLDEFRAAFEISGNFGMLDYTPVSDSLTPSGMEFSDSSTKYGYSGAMFLALNIDPKIVLKFGGEFIKPLTLSSISGSSSGTEVLTGSTRTYIMNPGVGFDLAFFSSPIFRVFIGSEIGYSILRSTVTWDYTAAGEALGYTDIIENIGGNAIGVNSYFGIEYALVDQFSIIIRGGYRYLKFTTIKNRDTDATIAGRSLDFSGFTGCVAFRLYL